MWRQQRFGPGLLPVSTGPDKHFAQAGFTPLLLQLPRETSLSAVTVGLKRISGFVDR